MSASKYTLAQLKSKFLELDVYMSDRLGVDRGAPQGNRHMFLGGTLGRGKLALYDSVGRRFSVRSGNVDVLKAFTSEGTEIPVRVQGKALEVCLEGKWQSVCPWGGQKPVRPSSTYTEAEEEYYE